MPDVIDDAVGRCLEKLGFKEPNRTGQDAQSLLGGNYVIIELYPQNRQGVVVSRRTTGYKKNSKRGDGINPLSSISKDVILFSIGDVNAGLEISTKGENKKPYPYSTAGQLNQDLLNMFRNAWHTSDIGDYLGTVYNQLLKYASVNCSQRA